MAHVFDLATYWPDDPPPVVAVTQGWFGIPTDDGGPDSTYGNWDVNGATWSANDPIVYPPIPYAGQDASVCNGGHRWIGSHLRPLVGLYSDSGRDAAGIAQIDRRLAMIRTDSNPAARITHLAVTVVHLAFTSQNNYVEGVPGYAPTSDYRWRSLVKTLERANAAGLTNCVTASYEPGPIWAFYDDEYPTDLAKLGAVAYDVAALVLQMKDDPASFKVNGRLVLYLPPGASTLTSTEWNGVLDYVRTAAGHDFYVIARGVYGTDFEWADGLYPWIRYSKYIPAAGDTQREKSKNWLLDAIESFNDAVGSYSGRIVIANLLPGAHDYVLDWGAGATERYIPRSSETILGQFDALDQLRTDGTEPEGLYLATWDDYPEGTVWEPTANDNGEPLRIFIERVAEFYGESVDEFETEATLDVWRSAVPSITCPAPYRQSGRQVALRTSINLTSGGPA